MSAMPRLVTRSANIPVLSQWQLMSMPTVPFIRLELQIHNQPSMPYLFVSFSNVVEEDQGGILAEVSNQDRL
jgi:hypothetical protein